MLAENLFHFKKGQAEYSIKPEVCGGRSQLEATLLQEGGQPNFVELVYLLRVVQSFVRLTVAMGRGGRPRTRRMSRIARWRPSLHRMTEADDDSTRAGNEAGSAQLFLALSDIAWYIAGAGCYITPFISEVLYS